MPPVDTRSSSGYRTLRFESIDECISDVKLILAASEVGRLHATGNWTPGEIMTHLANWIQYPPCGIAFGISKVLKAPDTGMAPQTAQSEPESTYRIASLGGCQRPPPDQLMMLTSIEK